MNPPRPAKVDPTRPASRSAGRDQDQSIKARKRLLYDEEEGDATPVAPIDETKPFADYLRTTPAAPMSAAIKALLGAVGLVVALLLLAAVLRMGRKSPARPRVDARRPGATGKLFG